MTKNNGTERTEKKGHRYEEEVDAYCPAASLSKVSVDDDDGYT